MAIKKADKNRSQSSRNLEDHVVAKATTVEMSLDEPGKALQWDVTKGEVHSDIKLEDDSGNGKGVIIRSFDFRVNPEAFKRETPSKHQLFAAHEKEILLTLWKDGLQPMPEVNVQVKLSKNRKFYRIVVGAEPRKGEFISEKPQTLSQIANA